MKSIAEAKYNQSEIGKNTLLATKNAKLLHFLPRSKIKYEHFKHLEQIRNQKNNALRTLPTKSPTT